MKAFISKVAIYSILFLVIISAIGYWIEKERADKLIFHPQLRWEEFHASSQNSMDLIFLGSSHCYRTFVPKIFDERMGVNSFNLGSSSQSIFTSYFVLKEALEFQSPKLVVFEVFNGTFEVDEDKTFVDLMYNYDYFHSKNVKFEVKSNLSISKNIEILLPAFRFNHSINLFLEDSMVNADKLKNSLYLHKGYVETDLPASYYEYESVKNVSIVRKELEALQLKYFEKIIQLLKEKNIELILITQPIHPQAFFQLKHLDQNDFLDSIASIKNLDYYNFNSNEVFSASDYYDSHHFNKIGAENLVTSFATVY